MKLSSLLLRSALPLVLGCFASTPVFAQDATPPVVSVAISDLTVSENSAPTVVNLKKTFALQGVTGKIVRLATTEGNIDVELLASAAPASVTNFLSYANAGSYDGSFIHRSIPGFVIQGGGYKISNDQVVEITEGAAVAGEHTLPNTRGTLAFALSTGPDSGTDQWFFNLADNAMLDDTSDGGPFTVFGRIVGNGLAVADAIAGLKIVNAGSPFDNLPVLPSYTGSKVEFTDLVYLTSVTNLPLTPKVQGDAAALVLKVKANTNPDLVTASINARKLTLTYAAGKTGSSTITVMAKNPVTKSKARATFTVTVQ